MHILRHKPQDVQGVLFEGVTPNVMSGFDFHDSSIRQTDFRCGSIRNVYLYLPLCLVRATLPEACYQPGRSLQGCLGPSNISETSIKPLHEVSQHKMIMRNIIICLPTFCHLKERSQHSKIGRSLHRLFRKRLMIHRDNRRQEPLFIRIIDERGSIMHQIVLTNHRRNHIYRILANFPVHLLECEARY